MDLQMEQRLGTSLFSLILFVDILPNSNLSNEFSFFLFLLHIVCSDLHCNVILLSKHFKVECVIVCILEWKETACSERIKIHYLYAVGSMNEKTQLRRIMFFIDNLRHSVNFSGKLKWNNNHIYTFILACHNEKQAIKF